MQYAAYVSELAPASFPVLWLPSVSGVAVAPESARLGATASMQRSARYASSRIDSGATCSGFDDVDANACQRLAASTICTTGSIRS